MSKVTKALVFVLDDVEFADTVLYPDEVPDELNKEETEAAAKIGEYANQAIADLLVECRKQLLAVVPTSVYATAVQRNPQRGKLEESWFFSLPLRISGSTMNAGLDVGFFDGTTDSGKRTIQAVLWTRRVHAPALDQLKAQYNAQSLPGDRDRTQRIYERTLLDGDEFANIASELAGRAKSWIADLDTKIAEA